MLDSSSHFAAIRQPPVHPRPSMTGGTVSHASASAATPTSGSAALASVFCFAKVSFAGVDDNLRLPMLCEPLAEINAT
jgi:hypothetical protein